MIVLQKDLLTNPGQKWARKKIVFINEIHTSEKTVLMII